MSVKEFDAITDFDDRFRYELIEGVLVVLPMPPATESGPNDQLGYLLRNYRDRHPEGWRLDDTLPMQYVRTSNSCPLPDRLIWTGLGRVPDLEVDLPTIVAEFVSKPRMGWPNEFIVRRREYNMLGIPEYWIIDRFKRIMTVSINEADKQRELIVDEREKYCTLRLPGFELPLSRLLEEADKWANTRKSRASKGQHG